MRRFLSFGQVSLFSFSRHQENSLGTVCNYTVKANKSHSRASEPLAYQQGLVTRGLVNGMARQTSVPPCVSGWSWWPCRSRGLRGGTMSAVPPALPPRLVGRVQNTRDCGNIFLHINIYVKPALLRRWRNEAWKHNETEQPDFSQIFMREENAENEGNSLGRLAKKERETSGCPELRGGCLLGGRRTRRREALTRFICVFYTYATVTLPSTCNSLSQALITHSTDRKTKSSYSASKGEAWDTIHIDFSPTPVVPLPLYHSCLTQFRPG